MCWVRQFGLHRWTQSQVQNSPNLLPKFRSVCITSSFGAMAGQHSYSASALLPTALMLRVNNPCAYLQLVDLFCQAQIHIRGITHRGRDRGNGNVYILEANRDASKLQNYCKTCRMHTDTLDMHRVPQKYEGRI